MKRLLIVVDYQIDFVSGSLGFEKAKNLDLPISNKIKEYRNNGDEIAFTFDTHDNNYLNTFEGKHLPVSHCIINTIGHDLYGNVGLNYDKNDITFCKNTFGSDELYEFLKTNKYESIELVGLVSNICVLSNAVLARTAQHETQIIVDSSCIASNDEIINIETLDVLKGLQIKVI